MKAQTCGMLTFRRIGGLRKLEQMQMPELILLLLDKLAVKNGNVDVHKVN